LHLNIIHFIDSGSKINFGIWNAALNQSVYSRHKHHCWFSQGQDNINFEDYKVSELSKEGLFNHNVENTVFVGHGCWKAPGRMLLRAINKGFQTIYVPHGMLEPWSLQNKKLKKQIYFQLIEKRIAQKATVVRAVGSPEKANLEKLLRRSDIVYIPNGSKLITNHRRESRKKRSALFMARLHMKKGIVPLVEAWSAADFKNDWELIIAGPDEGELKKIRPYLNRSIKYVGPVYGKQKEQLLENSHFFMLPSFSEGFPSSVVEALGYGLIPVISKGCNFPEVFKNKSGVQIEPNKQSISSALQKLDEMTNEDLDRVRQKAHELTKNYDIKKISAALDGLYEKLMVGQASHV